MTFAKVPGGDALGQIAAAIGVDAAHALAREYGGTTIYVPHAIDQGHHIHRALGAEISAKLAKWYGGSRLDVPKRAHRQRLVRQLRREGALTVAQIARETSYSERQVYRLLADEPDDRQPDLFGE